jgi:hypothetical protein
MRNFLALSWWDHCCLIPNEEFSSYIMGRSLLFNTKWGIFELHVYHGEIIRWEDDDFVCGDFPSSTIVVIGTDSTSSCKSNHNKITQYIMCWSNVGSNKWLWKVNTLTIILSMPFIICTWRDDNTTDGTLIS